MQRRQQSPAESGPRSAGLEPSQPRPPRALVRRHRWPMSTRR